jgi:hypothetical protein
LLLPWVQILIDLIDYKNSADDFYNKV